MQSEFKYQSALIALGVVATLLLGVFFFREVAPEYRIYQEDFIALEKFRSTYTHEPPAPFKLGVKQIVIEREDKGQPVIDRCTSCHVALQIQDYSSTQLKRGPKGEILYDEKGVPLKEENPNYIWKKLDEAIAKSTSKEEIANWEALKSAHVGEHLYDVKKALVMHPLIGKETRPFEFHSIDEYGCVACHSGNGRGLVTDRAHGAVFDGEYEDEIRGFTPQFLEKDEKNDPPFSKVFNAKPGHRLLFQTNPIYVGALIQARCVNCHQENQEGVDELTQEYQLGEFLFLSQGCYACHRIAGFSRGGVGPELTREGDSYPWFVKESIVWPQADLKTSTMPNLRLDHEELEALLTYLLAQTSSQKVLSEPALKAALNQWEGGKKLPWETPVPITKSKDVRYGMTVFATEGCASCHRLEGYDTNVSFALEKTNPSEEALLKEKKWFKNLFPENIIGSEIIKTIEKNQAEIDQRIVKVDKEGLLEELEKQHPDLIESFYSNFKFAKRAHNRDDLTLKQQWQDRVHKVLKMFVRTYGLGRVICPKPNWAGVYRSDQWLMEHFKSPSSHVPKSIMPLFPFDESKFNALTYMLDIRARENVQSEVKAVKVEGFNPETAYQIYCAQCHGEGRKGNGPVSEWLYPIPKNLNNSEFLRNLTKERAIESITHGVKGTPMPPWGELGLDKPFENHVPVLSEQEIRTLVDWLFAKLPGERAFREVPKWSYQVKDVLSELQNEHSPLDDVFNALPSKEKGPEKESYYIKQKFYTPENVLAGERFFTVNCAACHGKEADGAGVRAEAMSDAKPRMLTNIDWLSSRDDLRLLRSIKYGVPGTAMTPWGDLTSSLQRLQLVIYIRSLSMDKQARRDLSDALYEAFDGKNKSLANDKKKEFFSSLGNRLLSVNASGTLQSILLEMIQKGNSKDLQAKFFKEIEFSITQLKQDRLVAQGKIQSVERALLIQDLDRKIEALEKFKNEAKIGFENDTH